MWKYNDRKTHHNCINQNPHHVPEKRKKSSQELGCSISLEDINRLAGWQTGDTESKSMTLTKKEILKKKTQRQDSQSRCLFDRLSTLHLLQQKWRQHLPVSGILPTSWEQLNHLHFHSPLHYFLLISQLHPFIHSFIQLSFVFKILLINTLAHDPYPFLWFIYFIYYFL